MIEINIIARNFISNFCRIQASHTITAERPRRSRHERWRDEINNESLQNWDVDEMCIINQKRMEKKEILSKI